MLSVKIEKQQTDKILSLFESYKTIRPKPDRNLDQFLASEETVLKRALILGQIDKISDKKVLFLGDDDITSVVFSLLFKSKQVTVVDIDQRQLDFIKHIAQNENLSINCFNHDLQKPLPKSEFKDYDVVFFDPPYTPYAVNTWLIRAMQSTLESGSNIDRKKPEVLSSKIYFMCYGYTNRSLERGFKIQEIITSLGLIIQEKERFFNKYKGAPDISGLSDLYVLQPTPKVNIRQLDIERSRFYTGQTEKSTFKK